MADDVIKIEDIVDGARLYSWLTDWPVSQGLDEKAARQISVTIAFRAAMRVVPIWWEYSRSENAHKRHLTALPILRSLLISGVVAKSPNPEKYAEATTAATDRAVAATDASAEAANARAASDTASAATAASATAASATATADAAAHATAATAATTASATTRAAARTAATVWASIRADCTAISTDIDVLVRRFGLIRSIRLKICGPQSNLRYPSRNGRSGSIGTTMCWLGACSIGTIWKRSL